MRARTWQDGLAHPLKGEVQGPQAVPRGSPGVGGGRRLKHPPTHGGELGPRGQGDMGWGTHSVEHNAKNSVHPLDEATEYLVYGVGPFSFTFRKRTFAGWLGLPVPWAAGALPSLGSLGMGAWATELAHFVFPSRAPSGGGKVGFGAPSLGPAEVQRPWLPA